MSSVEIVAFNKKGEAYYVGEVNNAWRGCMSIWKELERKIFKTNIFLFLPFKKKGKKK